MFQSTRPARGATPCKGEEGTDSLVSIHAPRAGRDGPPQRACAPESCFNPRAPRGARRNGQGLRDIGGCFNPRAPRGARPLGVRVCEAIPWFQSTRPARGATTPGEQSPQNVLFQSTRPARGATLEELMLVCHGGVSIHAPRAGRDKPRNHAGGVRPCFNPRAPRGARLFSVAVSAPGNMFQSTRPARGATPSSPASTASSWFQSTRPARGATVVGRQIHPRVVRFNPRAPRGARPTPGEQSPQNVLFQSTRPARGATSRHTDHPPRKRVSIHAPRAGRDGGWLFERPAGYGFQSTRPARGAT